MAMQIQQSLVKLVVTGTTDNIIAKKILHCLPVIIFVAILEEREKSHGVGVMMLKRPWNGVIFQNVVRQDAFVIWIKNISHPTKLGNLWRAILGYEIELETCITSTNHVSLNAFYGLVVQLFFITQNYNRNRIYCQE